MSSGRVCILPQSFGKLQVGNPRYAAPELLRAIGKHKHSAQESPRYPITPAVDIYSFGVVLWKLLTQERISHGSSSLREPR